MSKNTAFTAARFTDENEARKYFESLRWPDGPVCPHCGALERISPLKGKTQRPGLYWCGDCRQQFTVTVGTVLERSKVPLTKWLLCAHLMCSSKKGMSSHQIHRILGVTYKTAWFMTHRLREAMRVMGLGKLGGGGGIVEADETYFGTDKVVANERKAKKKKMTGGGAKLKIFALVERGGAVRSFHVEQVTGMTLKSKLLQHVDKSAHLMTDEAGFYKATGKQFASHEAVNHSKYEYVRGIASTNSIESYFAVLKRGLIGTYHHVGEQHLQRYLQEFDFRYTHRKVTDAERTDNMLRGIDGKRLTYRRIDQAQV